MKTLLELEPNDCRYPFGDEDFQFCGAHRFIYLKDTKLRHSPYCREHHFICVVEPKPHKPAHVRIRRAA